MSPTTRENLSRSISQLMPSIIQGVHLGFLAKRSITHTQFFVLVAIHSNGRCPMTRLAANMHVSLPTISGIVNRLTIAGFVRRIDDPHDRRQVVVELSNKGRQLIEQFQNAVMLRWSEVLLALDEKEVESFTNIVTKLRQELKG